MKSAAFLAVALALAPFTDSAASVIQTEQAKLLASDQAEADWFGHSVSLDGDTAIIGAKGVDDNGPDSGAAYIFELHDEVWTERSKLLASDGGIRDSFGHEVSLDGNTAIVGVFWDDHIGLGCGAAYIFVRGDRVVGKPWEQQAKLLPADDGEEDADFGYAVSIDGATVV